MKIGACVGAVLAIIWMTIGYLYFDIDKNALYLSSPFIIIVFVLICCCVGELFEGVK